MKNMFFKVIYYSIIICVGILIFYTIIKGENSSLKWKKSYSGKNNDFGISVEETKNGGYIIGGESDSKGAGGYDLFLMKVDDMGKLIWEKNFGGGKNESGGYATQTPDGGYIICGSTYSYGSGGNDAFLVKSDSEGNER